jgi:hypothetical protein
MNFKFLKAAIVSIVLTVSSFANAGLITLSVSGTDVNDSSNYYLANITFDDSIAGESGSNTILGITDFQMRTFGAFETTFGFEDIDRFSWYYLYSNDLGSPRVYEGLSNRAYFAIGVSNDDGYSMTNTNYISQGLYLNNSQLVRYLNDPIGSRTAVLEPSTAVPEPSTLAIFALGLMGLASRRFKKQS